MAGTTVTPHLLELRDASDPTVAGEKAVHLARLLSAGFLVPDGVVLTAPMMARLPDDGPMPAELAAALESVAQRFGDEAVAVRSSGIAEDLPDASYAGQYETILNVRGHDAIVAAVRACAASAASERVRRYRSEHGEAGRAALAVIVQRQVQPDAAGVAFSANPVSGDRSEAVVSAVRGLGERLVSGTASPDEWVVRGTVATAVATPEGAIDAAAAARIAAIARRVEQHFGSPQDIEWAIAGEETYLLQARPITALPPSPDGAEFAVDVPDGFWEREASHYPKPLSPLTRSIFLPALNRALSQTFREFGLVADGLEFDEIGGWVYQRLVPPGGKERATPPRWLMWLLVRALPDMRQRTQKATEAHGSDLSGRLVERWYSEWQPLFARGIEELHNADLASMDEAALRRHLERTRAFLDEGADVHFILHGALAMILYELAVACRELCGWDATQTLELVNGLSDKSTEPARRLYELAQRALERDAVRALLERPAGEALARLREVDAQFADAFDAYQREYGCRALRYEVADLSVAEAPEIVLALLRDQIHRGYDPDADAQALAGRRDAAAEEARASLQSRPEKERARFERLLERARRAYPVREDNEFFTISAPLALLRYAALEAGRRLASRGQIAEMDDVFFLEWDETMAALGDGGARHDLVARRKRERAWAEAHPGPASYGPPPAGPPPVDALPADARFSMEALMWVREQIFAPEVVAAARDGADGVRGVPASPGVYTGTARVVMDETEFDKIQPGDVLVCPITSPVWSVVFPSIGALVTDTGGVLSHPAIIAREYRVPAVVATANATARLRDGASVTVDGSTGTVTVHE